MVIGKQGERGYMVMGKQGKEKRYVHRKEGERGYTFIGKQGGRGAIWL